MPRQRTNARAVNDIYVFAYGGEGSGRAYLAHSTGGDFEQEEVPIPSGGVWSMTGATDDSLWLTSPPGLWRKTLGSPWTAIALPEAPDGSPLRAVHVIASGGDVWVTAQYGITDEWALLRRGPVAATHHCPW